jgi:hypothetical protein
MPLDWDLRGIVDHETTCFIGEPDAQGRRELNPVTNAIIWMCMATDIGEITAANAEEFYIRAYAWERMNGPMLRNGDGTERYLTAFDVREHVGIHTNVFPKTTVSRYARKLYDGAEDRAKYAWQRAMSPVPDTVPKTAE